MQRVKKKPKKKKVLMGTSEIDRMKREISSGLTDRLGMLILAATVDVVGLNEEQVCQIIALTNHYADYLSEGVVTWEDVRKSIEKNAGVSMKGW